MVGLSDFPYCFLELKLGKLCSPSTDTCAPMRSKFIIIHALTFCPHMQIELYVLGGSSQSGERKRYYFTDGNCV